MSIGAGFTAQPFNSATIAAAQTLAWLFAMWPLLGINGATWIESPITWMSLATLDSKFW